MKTVKTYNCPQSLLRIKKRVPPKQRNRVLSTLVKLGYVVEKVDGNSRTYSGELTQEQIDICVIKLGGE